MTRAKLVLPMPLKREERNSAWSLTCSPGRNLLSAADQSVLVLPG